MVAQTFHICPTTQPARERLPGNDLVAAVYAGGV